MQSSIQLQQTLHSIHRKSYPAYKSLRGQYDFGDYILSIDHVQGDPFASPSSVSVVVPMKKAAFPKEYWEQRHTRYALEDALLRKFSKKIQEFSHKAKGSGKSGLVATSRPGQEILHRSAMVISSKEIVARFEVGFPANGRTINAYELEKVFFEFLPPVVQQCLYYRKWNPQILKEVYELAMDQEYVRQELPKRNLTAFIAEGSILPRMSGISSRPLKDAVPVSVPESLKVEMNLPFRGKIYGIGIKKGVTLIIGGGYHGKSTLLQALEQGVYNHIAGDGREFAITEETAMKLRAEDGRSIQNLDLSLFIHNLPNGKNTSCFSTEDASGSTSQGAAVMEALEAGCNTFLIDEDTSATNYLVRDEFMQKIVHGDKEPITPYCARIRDLYEKQGVSTILVAGSSGAFFHVADTVIQMDEYRPLDVKERVEAYLSEYPFPVFEASAFVLNHGSREFWGLGKVKGDDRMKTKVMGRDGFSINHEMVDLRYVEQLVDSEQTAALAGMMKYVLRKIRKPASVTDVVAQIMKQLEAGGLEAFMDGYGHCGLALPRMQEIYAMLNRYR